MLTKLVEIVFSILLAIGAGATSLYTSLEQNLIPQAPVEIPFVARGVATTTKKVASPKVVTAKASSLPKVASQTEPSLVVIAPTPLSAPVSSAPSSDTLSTNGVIAYTNLARAQNGGLPALTENLFLDQDAKMKLDDMFAKQYFEHISPTGDGPAELANRAGYAYVLVGENLALGDFGNDAKLVDAWMNSPGHRANILNTRFQEIGVAVGKGMYKGNNTWLAVQSFGMPLSACPTLEKDLKVQIDTNNTEIANLRTAIDAKKALIDKTSPVNPFYNTYVVEYNSLIKQYEDSISINHALILKYNGEVQAFNACVVPPETS
ncbi:MAG: CAP domain-containing protein [Candidatus Pacebacteria bacterium]|nr:CAP domain-containing protein [Candidatus Paceibacterota bacterium]